MGFFLGRHDKAIDKKGRVSIPAEFRAALGDEVTKGVYAFPSVGSDTNCIQIWPAQRMARLVRKMDEKFDQLTDKQRKMARLVLHRSRLLSVEDTGRIQPPPDLLNRAGITDAVSFAGDGTTFAMWEPSKLDTYEDDLETVEEAGAEDLLFSIVSGGDGAP